MCSIAMNIAERLILFILVLLAACPLRAGEYAVYEGREISRLDFELVDCDWFAGERLSLARDLVSLEEGQTFSAAEFEDSLAKLELSGRFSALRPELAPLADGLQISFYLTPARIIRDVRFIGIAPLFKSDILKALTVHVGGRPGDLAEQTALIRELYLREGFVDPKVEVRVLDDPGEGTCVLQIAVESGSYYVIRQLDVEGNRALSDSTVKTRMQSWLAPYLIGPARRFRLNDFEQDLRKLRSYYWQRGYPECSISYDLEYDQNRVLVKLNVSEGPHYRFRIDGNHRFYSYTLRKHVTIFKEGNRRDRGLRESMRRIESYYRSDGFHEVRIELLSELLEKRGRTTRRVTIQIDEGPRSLIAEVSFSGNQAFDDKTLGALMSGGWGRQPFVPGLLDQDLATLLAHYRLAGYHEVQITPDISWQGHEAYVELQIEEGLPLHVATLQIEGLHDLSVDQSLLNQRPGAPFSGDQLRSDEKALAAQVAGLGYPFVKVSSQVEVEGQEVGIGLSVDRGQPVRMGRVYYQGNFKTRPRVLNRELEIDEGEPFSLESMLESQKNIRDMGVFDSVQFKTVGLREQDEKITLLVDMEEAAPYYLRAGTGYTTHKGLYLNTRLGDRNLLGRATDTWIDGEVSQTGYKGELSLTQHRIFNSEISTKYTLAYEKKEEFNQTFGTQVRSSDLSLFRDFEKWDISSSLGLRYEWRDEYPLSDGVTDLAQEREIMVLAPLIIYDLRDSFVRPRSGLVASLGVDISHGLKRSYDSFIRYKLGLRYYWSPLPRLTLAWLGRYGYIDPYGSYDLVPRDQLFYLGGTLDVRGFEENMLRFNLYGEPVGGRSYILGSMEARIMLQSNWEMTVFYDTGAVRQLQEDGVSENYRASMGLGCSYITPIGPVSLLYGHKLDRKSGESPGRFHFTIGYTF